MANHSAAIMVGVACAGALGFVASSARSDVTGLCEVPIQQVIEHRVRGSCAYRATIDGSLTVLPTREREDRARYAPNLLVHASWRCRGTLTHETRAVIVAPPLTAGELQRVVAARARIQYAHDGLWCFYDPKLTFRDGRFESTQFARWCRPEPPALGGGPPR